MVILKMTEETKNVTWLDLISQQMFPMKGHDLIMLHKTNLTFNCSNLVILSSKMIVTDYATNFSLLLTTTLKFASSHKPFKTKFVYI